MAPGLIDAISESDHDLVAFTPYLYHPTVVGLSLVRDRAILHPAAHDEPAIRLPLFDEVFEAARGLAFYTRGRACDRRDALPRDVAKPQVVVGLGIDVPPPAERPLLTVWQRSSRGPTSSASAASITARAPICSRRSSFVTRSGILGPSRSRSSAPCNGRCRTIPTSSR